ncbi:hypothetical protein Desde_1053 [Desulfitobacterium dehalogenans ATCC 51507]|uniref:Uncharacterized protein n=1 Tax=Desulfitobacterium dehalogenans (strain ATCC 51507 / DSM 9161 / JW/IU-DC1) TaxID=756499 RepID=I4A6A1_DESDJ|nr:hypothetical protein [Desulfitobacterium dehalogenans]AFL99485.1 hypothetical protein Desde_1053 [Desulfitobacterium dehalogenans ATCC 51507]
MDLRSFAYDLNKNMRNTMVEQQNRTLEVLCDALDYSQKKVDEQLDVTGFKTNIMALPEKIRVQQEKVKEASDAFEVVKSNLVNAESMLMSIITAEVNGAGKSLYSNDKARQAELEIRKKMDFEYQQAWEPYKAALDELDNARFKLEQYQNEFKAYQVVGNMLAARLSLMKLEV